MPYSLSTAPVAQLQEPDPKLRFGHRSPPHTPSQPPIQGTIRVVGRGCGAVSGAEIRRMANFGSGSKALIVPDTITLMLLPPYSPELNPVETLWQYLRQNNLANRVFDNHDEIVDVCCTAWNSLMAMPQRLASITLRDWAKVNG